MLSPLLCLFCVVIFVSFVNELCFVSVFSVVTAVFIACKKNSKIALSVKVEPNEDSQNWCRVRMLLK